MSIMKEFKEFAVKGNVLDMAVGLIIGAEFGKIVNSMVQDVIMPPIGLLLGGLDFRNLFLTLKDGALQPGPYLTLEQAKSAGAVTMNLGSFFSLCLSFLIIAWVVFLLIKGFNRLRTSSEK